MKQTYAQLTAQIAELKQQADHIKREEVSDVVLKVRALVATYDLTSEEIFGKGKPVAPKAKRPSRSKAKTVMQFNDGNGNGWVGRGPRPQWLRDALTGGKTIEDFRAR